MKSEPVHPPTASVPPVPPKLPKVRSAILAAVLGGYLLAAIVAHSKLGFDVPNTVSLGVELLIVGLLFLFDYRQSKYFEALHEYTRYWVNHVTEATGWWEKHGEIPNQSERGP